MGRRGPKPRAVTAEIEAHLARASRAAGEREKVDAEYAESVLAAYAAGATYAAIAQAAGITESGARQLVQRRFKRANSKTNG